MEVFLPGLGEQIHELNLTQFPPVGLFWTIPIPSGGVAVDLSNGTASMHALRIPIFDYQTRNNSFYGGGPDPVPDARSRGDSLTQPAGCDRPGGWLAD